MRTFHSNKYRIIGYGPVSVLSGQKQAWVFETLPSKNITNFIPSQIIVSEARWVDGSSVFYLCSDGSIQDRTHMEILPL